MTAQEVADRAGISRGLLQRIEKGDPKCELGATFEVATILGITHFDAEAGGLTKHIRLPYSLICLIGDMLRLPHERNQIVALRPNL